MDLKSLKHRAFGLFGRLGWTARSPRNGGLELARLRPPAARGTMSRLLWALPLPLINPDAKLVVLFSPKSACTNVVIWFLHHLGHMDAARDFHRSPHRYLDRVYYRSPLYQRAVRLDLTGFTVVKVIRDPYQRAVSSFRHVVRTSLFDDDMERKLGDTGLAQNGLSFAAFLDFLEKTDLRRCNPHYSLQGHPIEAKLPASHLINVSREDLFRRLNEVESAIGLAASDLANAPWVRQFERRHHRDGGDFSGVTDFYRQRLRREQALKGPWPPYDALLTPEARERVARLYASDIAAYL